MNLQEALDAYQGIKLQPNQLSRYQQWAFSYFHDENFVANPNLSITLHLDLVDARDVYESSFQSTKGASFQAYLVWNLVKALSLHWTFNTRKVNGEWYLFKNLPVYFPIAVGGEDRFKDVMINDVTFMDWAKFSRVYRNSIQSPTDIGSIPTLIWEISHFIGNLPALNFTSFQIHRGIRNAARPIFYFGQRYNLQQRQKVPVSVTFDHANADPYVLNNLIQTYQNLLTEKFGTGASCF